MNNWHKIFNKNSTYIKFTLNDLMAYSLYGIVHSFKSDIFAFKTLVKFIAKCLNIKKSSSLLDYGSGNGAFLFALTNYFSLKKNISIEINKFFITFQKKYIKNTKFYIGCNEKILKKIKSNSVDNVICNSVFQYFPTEKIAQNILLEFVRISKKNIFLYDIKNEKYKISYKKTVRLRQNLSISEFEKKYKNTPIRFYSKSFFLKNLNLKKKTQSIKIISMPKDTLDSKFGFCVLIKK
jgi:ubiquinone/menaquinone biosynthesis C-methylase UbiE